MFHHDTANTTYCRAPKGEFKCKMFESGENFLVQVSLINNSCQPSCVRHWRGGKLEVIVYKQNKQANKQINKTNKKQTNKDTGEEASSR